MFNQVVTESFDGNRLSRTLDFGIAIHAVVNRLITARYGTGRIYYVFGASGTCFVIRHGNRHGFGRKNFVTIDASGYHVVTAGRVTCCRYVVFLYGSTFHVT